MRQTLDISCPLYAHPLHHRSPKTTTSLPDLIENLHPTYYDRGRVRTKHGTINTLKRGDCQARSPTSHR